MDLDTYLWRERIAKSTFAKRLGISRCYLHHMISGVCVYSHKIAREIDKITGGKVSYESLIEQRCNTKTMRRITDKLK